MKWWNTKCLWLAMLCVCLPGVATAGVVPAPSCPDTLCTPAPQALADTAKAQDSFYQKHVEHWQWLWKSITPNVFVVQYAGSIGLISYGLGWHYGRHDNWETHLMLGHVPAYHSDKSRVTFTLKERYTPWKIPAGSRWSFEPLQTGLYVNTIFGEDYWAREPRRYSNGYYGFATKVRFGLFVGSEVQFNIPKKHRLLHRSISAYYELGTNDLYLISALPNKNVGIGDILSLAFGLKMEVF